MHKCMPYIDSPFHSRTKQLLWCLLLHSTIFNHGSGNGGIYDLYIDFPQQKITIIGWADPEKIVRAIKKTRKSAVICSHTEQSDQPTQETEPSPPKGEAPPPDGGAPPPESTDPPTEPPPPLPDNPPVEEKPSPECANERTSQSSQPSEPKEEIHVIYHNPPKYGHQYNYGHYPHEGNSGQWKPYPTGPGFRMEPPHPVMNLSYNTYRPLPYVTEYANPQSPQGYLHHTRPDHYSQVYYSGNSSNGNSNITSLFSEENPNACSIV